MQRMETKTWPNTVCLNSENFNVNFLDLAFCYQFGKGVPQDFKIAIKYFNLSTRSGNEAAQGCLEELLAPLKGEGSKKKKTL